MVSGSARQFGSRAVASMVAFLAGLAVTLAVVIVAPTQARAQEDWGASYITPFPENDTYRLQVIGDSMAEGLFSALGEMFRSDTRVQLSNRQHALGGLIRLGPDEFFKLEETIKNEPLHVAVVLLGIADRVALRAPDGRRVAIGSDEWKV